jgi:hypothetical protein
MALCGHFDTQLKEIMRGFGVIGSPEFNLLYRRMERPPESPAIALIDKLA